MNPKDNIANTLTLLGYFMGVDRSIQKQYYTAQTNHDDIIDASRYAFEEICGASSITKGDIVLKPGEFEVVQDLQIEDKSEAGR